MKLFLKFGMQSRISLSIPDEVISKELINEFSKRKCRDLWYTENEEERGREEREWLGGGEGLD